MFMRWIIMLLACAWLVLPTGVTEASSFRESVANLAEVTAVRVGAASDHIRIVIDATRNVTYRTIVLQNPGRIVVDLRGAWLSPQIERVTPLSSRFASKIRVGQFDKSTVRIVVETEVTKENFDIFALHGGAVSYRVVMDFGRTGKANNQENGAPTPQAAESRSETIEEPPPADTSTKPETAPTAPSEAPTGKTPGVQGAVTEISPQGATGAPGETQDDATAPKEDVSAPPEDADGQQPKSSTPTSDTTEDDDDDADEQGEALPKFKQLKGKKIAIDPGHGGEDSGAIGTNGVTEKSVTLRLANEVQRLLEASGAKVIMTRKTDTEVSPKHRQATDIEELQARCDIANKAKADIFVSIHMDSFTSREATGTTGYYYAKGMAASKRLATAVQTELVKELGTKSRGTKTCNFYVVRKTNMPATLIEVAFVSNAKEAKLITSGKGIQKAALGIVRGLAQYYAK